MASHGTGKPSMMDKAKDMIGKVTGHKDTHNTYDPTRPTAGGTTTTAHATGHTTGVPDITGIGHTGYAADTHNPVSNVTHGTTYSATPVGTHGITGTGTQDLAGSHANTYGTTPVGTTHEKPTLMEKGQQVLGQVEAKLPGHHAHTTGDAYTTGHVTDHTVQGYGNGHTYGEVVGQQHGTHGVTGAQGLAGSHANTYGTTGGVNTGVGHTYDTTGAQGLAGSHVNTYGTTGGVAHGGTGEHKPTMMEKAKGMVEQVEAKVMPGAHGAHTTQGHGTHDPAYGQTGTNTGHAQFDKSTY